MKKFVLAAALGAVTVSVPAFAQDREGRDMTRQEAQAMADMMFQRFDLNHDGIVTRQEVDQARSAMGNGGGKRADKMVERIFGDSQSITLQQFEAQAMAKFDREDVNHDGVVTAAERHAHRSHDQAQGQ